MACPCCNAPSCADECSGNGVPSQLAVTFTGVSFGANSDFDEDDLPFEIPTTFLVTLRDPSAGCRIWSEGFFPRAVSCFRCGTAGGRSTNGMAINIGRALLNPIISVQVLMFFGDVNAGGACLGISSELLNAAAGNVCSLPINATATNTSPVCGAGVISSVSFKIEAA